MKKIISVFFVIVVTFCFDILNVSAKDLTLMDTINKLNNSNVYNKFKNEGCSCKISATSSSIDINCNLKTEGTYNIHFDIINGTAFYYFDGNRNSSSTAEEALFDTLWLVQLTDIAATNSGLSIGNKGYEKVLFVFNAGSNYQQYGLKSSIFSYNYGSEKGYGISDFSVYLNDGSASKNKVENYNSNQNNTNNNTNTNSNNSTNNSTNNNTNNNSTNNNTNTNSNNSSNNNTNNNTNSNNSSNNSTNNDTNSNNSTNNSTNNNTSNNSTNNSTNNNTNNNNSSNNNTNNNSTNNNNTNNNDSTNNSTNTNSNNSTNDTDTITDNNSNNFDSDDNENNTFNDSSFNDSDAFNKAVYATIIVSSIGILMFILPKINLIFKNNKRRRRKYGKK